MAEKYIVNMPLKSTPDDTDLMIIEDAQDTKRMTWANIVKPIKDMIGNLASLTTNHKTTMVGATNELKDKIDTIEADNSLIAGGVVNDVLTFAESLPYRFKMGATQPTSTNLPSDDFKYAVLFVMYRQGYPYVFIQSHTGTIATASKSGQGWSAWNIR